MLVADAVVEAAIIDVEATEVPPEFNSLPPHRDELKIEDVADFVED